MILMTTSNVQKKIKKLSSRLLNTKNFRMASNIHSSKLRRTKDKIVQGQETKKAEWIVFGDKTCTIH